ncbi:hypothetical protein [Drosophila suzukii associated hytrosavirus 1]|nr:hypothetical protein [Drosophila suzukii associated hytrosavirus 1]
MTMATADDQIFTQYESLKQQQQEPGGHVMFDPLMKFKNLDDAKMNDHLSQEEYKNITPWRALTEVIAIPVVMLAFLVAFKMNIFIKIILIFMIIVHIIISTCLVSYLSKTCARQSLGITTVAPTNNKTTAVE